MYEIEFKQRIDDPEKFENLLLEIGSKFINEVYQEDYYFQHPCRDFRDSDEALRIRIEDSQAFISYKGPRLSKTMKSREEIEAYIPDPDLIIEILKRLGFKMVAVIRKFRKIYRYGEYRISLDNVEKLGYFIEIERLTHDIERFKAVEREINEFLGLIGLSHEKSILKSYLELYLEKENT